MTKLKLEQITPDLSQPRQEFNPYDLELLKKSISSQGVLQPLVVEKIKGNSHYLLIDGERRSRASMQLGLAEVPVEIIPSMSSDLERFIKRFHLQEQHRSWTYFDKAMAIKKMIESGELKEKEVGKVLGIGEKSVTDLLALLQMSKKTQESASKKRVAYSFLIKTNRLLNQIKDVSLRAKAEEAIIEKIENGKIKKLENLVDFTRAISKGGDKIVRKIIANPNYTSEVAMLDSKANDVKHREKLINGIHWLNGILGLAVKNRAYRLIDENDLHFLKQVQTKLNNFIELAEK